MSRQIVPLPQFISGRIGLHLKTYGIARSGKNNGTPTERFISLNFHKSRLIETVFDQQNKIVGRAFSLCHDRSPLGRSLA